MQKLDHLQKYLIKGYKFYLSIDTGKLVLDKDVIEFYDNRLLNNYNYIFDYVKENNKSIEIFADFSDNTYRIILDDIDIKENTIDNGLSILNGMLEKKILTLKK